MAALRILIHVATTTRSVRRSIFLLFLDAFHGSVEHHTAIAIETVKAMRSAGVGQAAMVSVFFRQTFRTTIGVHPVEISIHTIKQAETALSAMFCHMAATMHRCTQHVSRGVVLETTSPTTTAPPRHPVAELHFRHDKAVVMSSVEMVSFALTGAAHCDVHIRARWTTSAKFFKDTSAVAV